MGTHSHITVIKGGKRQDVEFTIGGDELRPAFMNWLLAGGPAFSAGPNERDINDSFDTGKECEGEGAYCLYIDHDTATIHANDATWPSAIDLLHDDGPKIFAVLTELRARGWVLGYDVDPCYDDANFKYEE